MIVSRINWKWLSSRFMFAAPIIFIAILSFIVGHYGKNEWGTHTSWLSFDHDFHCLFLMAWFMRIIFFLAFVLIADMAINTVRATHKSTMLRLNQAFQDPGLRRAAYPWQKVMDYTTGFTIAIAFAAFALLVVPSLGLISKSWQEESLKISLPMLVMISIATNMAFVMFVSQKMSEFLASLKAGVDSRFSNGNSLEDRFNSLPLDERTNLLQNAQLAGLDKVTTGLKKQAVADYERRRLEALEQEAQMDKATAPAMSGPGQTRPTRL